MRLLREMLLCYRVRFQLYMCRGWRFEDLACKIVFQRNYQNRDLEEILDLL